MQLDKFTVHDGKKLRYGYTTGSTSAGACKSAVEVYFNCEDISTIGIETPKGWDLDLDINTLDVGSLKEDDIRYKNRRYVKTSIIKDGGDDPDATHLIEIFATIRELDESKEIKDTGDNFINKKKTISLRGGVGVGRVTKKGLQVAIGKPAINLVPLKTIFYEVEKVLPQGKKIELTIDIPTGEKVGQKTFNPKLGILGGISILGTTGIVKPMSEEAFKDSIVIEMKMLVEEYPEDTIIITPGNYGKKFLVEELGIEPKKILIISNFMGFILDNIKVLGYKKIVLVGHIGKLIKVAGGIFHTHSKVADGRMEILGANALLAGETPEDVIKIIEANTTEEGLSYLKLKATNKTIAEKIKQKCEKRVFDEVEVEVLTFSFDHGELGRTEGFNRMVDKYMENKYEEN
ncbi:cobalt-precorrin-5B (C(1))-methyltransferase CbiD [Psychrilyobacter sp.]|uniref:cobalt-precorrin-5B (C(1))-methyltransferase CbiD n=1 Tax=Psychrilyobacter sp. TaxID=2586924 RepID=UPI0030167A08